MYEAAALHLQIKIYNVSFGPLIFQCAIGGSIDVLPAAAAYCDCTTYWPQVPKFLSCSIPEKKNLIFGVQYKNGLLVAGNFQLATTTTNQYVVLRQMEVF
jgi:hypothetical protein